MPILAPAWVKATYLNHGIHPSIYDGQRLKTDIRRSCSLSCVLSLNIIGKDRPIVAPVALSPSACQHLTATKASDTDQLQSGIPSVRTVGTLL